MGGCTSMKLTQLLRKMKITKCCLVLHFLVAARSSAVGEQGPDGLVLHSKDDSLETPADSSLDDRRLQIPPDTNNDDGINTNPVIRLPCCDLNKRPGGPDFVNNPDIVDRCIIDDPGCCDDGSWVCPALESSPSGPTLTVWTCNNGDRFLDNPKGPICNCCDPEEMPDCFCGSPACCPEGRWSCQKSIDDCYQCKDGPLPGRKQGQICGEGPYRYELPPWWDAIGRNHNSAVDGVLRRCFRRPHATCSGDRCGIRKTCYWGEQVCPEVNPIVDFLTDPSGPYPTTKCTCDGPKGTWTCDKVFCPETCPLVIDNDPNCLSQASYDAGNQVCNPLLHPPVCRYQTNPPVEFKW